MTSSQLNKVFSLLLVILSISVAWDLLTLISGQKQLNSLKSYIAFEQVSIENVKKKLVEQIKTSVAFKKPVRRNELSYLTGFESQPLEGLENLILNMHSSISTLDSLPYDSEDIQKYRQLMNSSKSQEIANFYKTLLSISMLERLADDVYDDSDCGFGDLGWKIIRPITSDSTYIGAPFNPDGRSKYAYQINGRYFEGEHFTKLYKIATTDTINITTILMHNAGIQIDTFYNNQQIIFDGRKRKSIGT